MAWVEMGGINPYVAGVPELLCQKEGSAGGGERCGGCTGLGEVLPSREWGHLEHQLPTRLYTTPLPAQAGVSVIMPPLLGVC